jgi:hypothetical protein
VVFPFLIIFAGSLVSSSADSLVAIPILYRQSEGTGAEVVSSSAG